MMIVFKKLEEAGLKVDVQEDGIVIYPKRPQSANPHFSRLCTALDLNGRDADDLSNEIHRITLMRAVRDSLD